MNGGAAARAHAAAIGMGERRVTYWRFDGSTYQPGDSWVETGAGSNADGNGPAIAQGGPSVGVTCR
ncbi:hypothetical protein WK03_21820 [Burkholderia cepacia]|nr:hypothetical protein WK03_21820 [Burkholderia cepacia]QOH37394.1 hypothetical protein C7S14_1034 [Burkholderia cepacia]